VPTVNDALLIAYKLSILTFYLGVLIYALPIPWRGFKRWAPTLIIDGIFTASLSLIFYLLFDAANYIMQLLGGSWDFFRLWLMRLLTWVLTVKGLLFTFKTILSAYNLATPFSSYMAPFERSLDLVYLTGVWLLGMAKLITGYGTYLAALGLVLYAIPFRVARSAGAWLLAFVLVFSVGLPVMPSFISTMASLPEPPGIEGIQDLGFALARVKVVDYRGEPLPYGMAYLWNNEYGTVARYQIWDGLLQHDNSGPLITVPSRVQVVYFIEVNGLRVTPRPTPVKPAYYKVEGSTWQLTLKTVNLVWLKGSAIAATSGTIKSVDVVEEEGATRYTITVFLDRGERVEIRAPYNCEIEANFAGFEVVRDSWSWAGLRGYTIRMTPLKPGTVTVDLKVGDCSLRKPSDLPDAMGILENPELDWNLLDLDIIATIIVYYVTVPLIYIFLLLVITYGVARLLGGRDRYMPKV